MVDKFPIVTEKREDAVINGNQEHKSVVSMFFSIYL